jgi:tetratricopeptide (TPR) repeat protein
MRSSIHSVQFDPSSRTWVLLSEAGRVVRSPVQVVSTALDTNSSQLDSLRLQLERETGYRFSGEAQSVLPLSFDEWSMREVELSQPTGSSSGVSSFSEENRMSLQRRLNEAWEESNWNGIATFARLLLDNRSEAEQKRDDWQLHALLADSFAQRGDLELADGIYKKLSQSAEQSILVNGWKRQQMAACFFSDDWTLAKWYLDGLISEDTNDWSLFRDRALVLEKLGMADQREDDLAQAISLGPDRRFLMQVAVERAEQQKWAEAAETYDGLAEDGFDNLEQMEGHVVSLIVVGEAERLRDCIEKLLDDIDQRSTVTLGHARTVIYLGYWGGLHAEDIPRYLSLAEKTFDRSHQDQPILRGQDFIHFGWALYRCGRPKEAIDRFEEARSLLGRETEMGKLGLALSLAANGDFDAAKEVNSRLSREDYLAQLPNQLLQTVFRHLTAELDELLTDAENNFEL